MPELVISITCGPATCASERGKFCQFFADRGFGLFPVCGLFPAGKEVFTELAEDHPGGSVLRCRACLDAERQEHE